MFFTPKWKKEAKLLVKGARKFLHYKRDLLKQDRIDEILSRREDLIEAIRTKDRERVKEASKQLQATCENALVKQVPHNAFEENVEVLFVAIVIALGLRAYYLQPFRIPTGSMEPTLNGITGHRMAEDDWPAAPVRWMQKITRGRTYVKVENDRDRTVPTYLAKAVLNGKTIERKELERGALEDYQWLHFFSRSRLRFKDAPPLTFPGTASSMTKVGLEESIKRALAEDGVIKKGTMLAEGYIDTGDLVLVDKISYHFRKPKRGEVFVFDTVGIAGIRQVSGEQGGGFHYIKRLCGVPGDELTIVRPNLLNHGRILQEPGIQRVARREPGYHGYNAPGTLYLSEFTGASLPLRRNGARPGQREYAALGDNTINSADSRYWGKVKEHNLVGPALFALWPFTSGHWGVIR